MAEAPPRNNQTAPPKAAIAAPWHEWVIAVGVTALTLLAIWTVFGDDLGHLFQPGTQPVSPAQTSVQKR